LLPVSGLKAPEVSFAVIGHLPQDRSGLVIGNHVGEPAALGYSGAYVSDHIVRHACRINPGFAPTLLTWVNSARANIAS
jgi:hypothetical protein